MGFFNALFGNKENIKKDEYHESVRLSQILATLHRSGIKLEENKENIDNILGKYYTIEKEMLDQLDKGTIATYLEADDYMNDELFHYYMLLTQTNNFYKQETPPKSNEDFEKAQSNKGRTTRSMITMARSGIFFNELSTSDGANILATYQLLESQLQEKISTGFLTAVEGEEWLISRLKELKNKLSI